MARGVLFPRFVSVCVQSFIFIFCAAVVLDFVLSPNCLGKSWPRIRFTVVKTCCMFVCVTCVYVHVSRCLTKLWNFILVNLRRGTTFIISHFFFLNHIRISTFSHPLLLWNCRPIPIRKPTLSNLFVLNCTSVNASKCYAWILHASVGSTDEALIIYC